MNQVLQDLINAINNIPESYYEMPTVAVQADNLVTTSRDSKKYERRLVAQLKSEYDNLIRTGLTGDCNQVETDFEVIKNYIFCPVPDAQIVKTHNKLVKRDSDKTISAITTIPDFFIHKEQNNLDDESQKLAVEVKTAPTVNPNDFFLDLFKLNVYVEKYNFQNGVCLLINNDINRIKGLINRYKQEDFYIADTRHKRIYFFIKADYNSKIEILNLTDN